MKSSRDSAYSSHFSNSSCVDIQLLSRSCSVCGSTSDGIWGGLVASKGKSGRGAVIVVTVLHEIIEVESSRLNIRRKLVVF